MAMKVQVKHGPNTLDVELDPAATAAQLQEALQSLTGVFVRKQKLIFKGKVLDPSKQLAAQGVASGAKLMLLTAQDGATGSAVATKGQQALNTLSQQKAQEAKARLEASFAAVRAGQPLPSGTTASVQHATRPQACSSVPELEQRQRNWRATGLLALRDLGLTSLPSQMLEPPPASPVPIQPWSEVLRGVDICHNQVTLLPPCLFTLTGLVSLKAASNQLTDTGIPWEGLAQLTGLTRLALDHNQLTSLPGAALAGLQRLKHLSITDNQLTSLAPETGQLRELQLLEADRNQIQELPQELGGCTALVELSACNNAVSQVPDSLSACTSLQCLKLDNNRVGQVPGSILQGCTRLWLLSLSNNPITIDQLRDTPGYAQLDDRRRARADKQIEGRVLLEHSSAFSEGADSQEWSHWGQQLKKLGGGKPQ